MWNSVTEAPEETDWDPSSTTWPSSNVQRADRVPPPGPPSVLTDTKMVSPGRKSSVVSVIHRSGPIDRPTSTPATLNGTVWLRMRSARLDEVPDRSDWLVLDAEGTPVRRVGLPPRFTPHHLDERGAWGVLRDELDVNYVARLALREKGG